jgi:predicted RNase H-like HicB family nuclease
MGGPFYELLEEFQRTYDYRVEIEWSDEDRVYIARVPDLKGLATHGDTREEALRNAREAIAGYLESLAERSRPKNKSEG